MSLTVYFYEFGRCADGLLRLARRVFYYYTLNLDLVVYKMQRWELRSEPPKLG